MRNNEQQALRFYDRTMRKDAGINISNAELISNPYLVFEHIGGAQAQLLLMRWTAGLFSHGKIECRVSRSRRTSLDSHDHRFDAGQLFDVRFSEAYLAHPSAAVGSRIVETTLGLEQHDQAHEQAGDIVPAIVVD